MKRLIYFTLILFVIIVSSCSKADQLLFSDVSRVQVTDTSTINYTFFYEPLTRTRDTVYIRVNTIGKTADYDRPVKIVQVAEANQPNPAVPGIQYVAMDDPAIKNLVAVKAKAVSAMIPVILLRDPSLKVNSYRLKLQLVENDQFSLGETQSRTCAVKFSDRLERFFSWRVDGTQAPAFNTFGKYSTAKHQFMIDVLAAQIDETWYQRAFVAGSLTHYANLLKETLEKFNTNPANIASGAAPLRETNDPNSPVVGFR